jgi:serine/threonine protein phosphatase PrpC
MTTDGQTENAAAWKSGEGLTSITAQPPAPGPHSPVSGPVCRILNAAGVTDRGVHRANNEDCYRIDGGLRLYLVADGMGGHVGGEIASQLAADAVVEALHDGRTVGGRADALPGLAPCSRLDQAVSANGHRLRLAVRAAQSKLIEAGRVDMALSGMGTTMVAALVSEGRLTVASVGDSRLYLFDGRTLRQVTRDDSWIEAILDENPDADRAALHVHPLRHALTNVLSTSCEAEIHIVEVSLAGGEVIALTTDGVHGTLESSQIAHLLATLAEPADAAAELVAAAIGSGSTDNCTAVVAICLREN